MCIYIYVHVYCTSMESGQNKGDLCDLIPYIMVEYTDPLGFTSGPSQNPEPKSWGTPISDDIPRCEQFKEDAARPQSEAAAAPEP